MHQLGEICKNILNNSLFKVLIVIAVIGTLLLSNQILRKKNGIQINKVTFTSDLSKRQSTLRKPAILSQNSQKIYAAIDANGTFGLNWRTRAVIKWYQDDNQLSGETISIAVNPPTVLTLNPSGKDKFEPGKYSLTIQYGGEQAQKFVFLIK